ncbi:cell adhesion protein [Brevibacillus laterosporus]|uniref:hypothetical protein n=1 Tax=Brevibacillus laterosporus TaxID=1465 RepID=UPI0003702715|nr:hypothetical protein [Brevibacillus laterosporus]ATO51384.1 cell adhesion protein [Brevibacillus laterosporus DSM 25]MBG9801202.1 cell adhesion protein [Brevibacillus laterosporus]MED2002721.1 cell adhesion protein [Brevibacillus laterosporus]MED4765083.1 cell adhesion protein [Brevibacillus laterosporus]TPH12369.1 cell adhesion protein [Brevibacillus laterosporus]
MELEENKVGEFMGIYKKWSGLIFDDKFDNGSIHSCYNLSPSNACSLDRSKNQLVMTHTDLETSVLFNVPKDEHTLMFEVTADYVPTELGDEGGILIWQDGYHRLEFLESRDTTVKEYSRWRAYKKGNKWTFFANRGYGWELFDTDDIVAEKMGVVVKNPSSSGYMNLNIDRLIVCKDSKITIGNLPPGFSVFLCDTDGYTVASSTLEENWTGVELELPTLSYHGMIRIYDSTGTLLSSLGPVEMYGGDVFLYGTDLRVLWKGVELSSTGETYLGTMYEKTIIVQMELHNPSSNKTATSISMRILKYLEEFGYEWADICHDDGSNMPTNNYSQTLDMGDLAPLTSRKFWMKVEKKSERFGLKPLHFILDINHL